LSAYKQSLSKTKHALSVTQPFPAVKRFPRIHDIGQAVP
jgi:hypothetical protein